MIITIDSLYAFRVEEKLRYRKVTSIESTSKFKSLQRNQSSAEFSAVTKPAFFTFFQKISIFKAVDVFLAKFSYYPS